MNRFVRPDEVTIALTHGDTITIRRELTHGERIDLYRRAYIEKAGQLVRDPLLTGMALVTAYLIDWTFQGEGDRKVPIKHLSVGELVDTLNAIQDEAFVEILEAIQAHEAQLAREKSLPEASALSAPTSTSRGDADGATNGSVV
jgi:hypothetical protein